MPAALPAQTIVGKRIRQYRQEKGLSQAELGALLGWDEKSGCPRISRYERGVHEADLQTLSRLAYVLEKPLPCFFAPSTHIAQFWEWLDGLSEERQKEVCNRARSGFEDQPRFDAQPKLR